MKNVELSQVEPSPLSHDYFRVQSASTAEVVLPTEIFWFLNHYFG